MKHGVTEFIFDKVFVCDDGRYVIGLQEYQNFEQEDGSIKAERVNAVMVMEARGNEFISFDPDVPEKSFWLNKIGVLSDEEFQEDAKKIATKEDRRKLYDMLKGEFEGK